MILDLIILSDNESIGAESKTNYSDLDVNISAKSNSNPLHVIDNELVDSDGLGLGVTPISNCLVTNY